MAAHQGLLARKEDLVFDQHKIFKSLLRMIQEYQQGEKILSHNGLYTAACQLGTSRRVRVRQAFKNGEISQSHYEMLKDQ